MGRKPRISDNDVLKHIQLQDEPISIRKLAKKLIMAYSSAHGAVRRLEKQKLVHTIGIKQKNSAYCTLISAKPLTITEPTEEIQAEKSIEPLQPRTITMKELQPGREFELRCRDALERKYSTVIRMTPNTDDGGIDLVMSSAHGDTVIQCKDWPNGTVGRPEVQKLHSAALTYGARKAMMMTSGKFSSPAREYAASLTIPIDLVEVKYE